MMYIYNIYIYIYIYIHTYIMCIYIYIYVSTCICSLLLLDAPLATQYAFEGFQGTRLRSRVESLQSQKRRRVKRRFVGQQLHRTIHFSKGPSTKRKEQFNTPSNPKPKPPIQPPRELGRPHIKAHRRARGVELDQASDDSKQIHSGCPVFCGYQTFFGGGFLQRNQRLLICFGGWLETTGFCPESLRFS